ncbi:MAG TPA: hypothetical protein VFB21_16720 [Chthonomonadaceae bacterium]|nr:hypothetical protein [Chthonomonadaceae bacterium]
MVQRMDSLARTNRRGFSVLLAWSLWLLAALPGASWQCLNGTPCPANCPMLRPAKGTVSACPLPGKAACLRCASAAPATGTCSVRSCGAASACTTSQCVLRQREGSVSTLQDRLALTAPAVALAPQPLVFPASRATQIYLPAALVFYPQRFLRPPPGRAPPLFL